MKSEANIRASGLGTKKRGYKSLVLILAVVLMLGGVVSGTVAWLISKTEPVVNTFTYGDIDLNLDETKLDENGDPVDEDGDEIPDRTTEGNDYEMIPGEEYLKDPVVTVLEGNEACWLFVKLEESGGVKFTEADGTEVEYTFDDYLNYTVAEGWTQLVDSAGEDVEGVYFRYVGEDTDNIAALYEILGYYDENGTYIANKIKVQDSVSKEMLNLLDNNGEDAATATYPGLSITSYAIQYSGFESEVSEGATESTAEQMNAAALLAWDVIEEQNSSVTP